MDESKHAEKVIEGFSALLSEEAKAHISEEHLQELALMVEAAIDASVIGVLAEYGGKLAAIADEMQKRAGSE